MTIKPRRIVASVRADGKSYFTRDDELVRDDPPPEQMSLPYPRWGQGEKNEIYRVWGTSHLPFTHPVDPEDVPSADLPGPWAPLGVRVSIITYPAGWRGAMFWTLTTDFIFMVSGEITCVLDSGEELTMHPGDVMVQAGSNKAWEVRGDEPATFGVVMCASVAVGVTPPGEQRAGPPLPDGVVLPVDANAPAAG
jgi:hypothetical protein